MQPGTQAVRLHELLAESEVAATRRQREAFDRAAGPSARRIVIYGAGGLGRRTLEGLRANGMDAIAFVDRNPAAWTRGVAGLPVFPPEDAVRRFGPEAAFVITVWNPESSGGMGAIAASLREMGCRTVVPFVWLYWKFPETFLPYYLWDLPARVLQRADDVREAFAVIDGLRSQAEFVRQLDFRLTGDPGRLRPPENDPQYFPSSLFRPREDECFIDTGAFNGDTLIEFANWTGGHFRSAWAFEADPANFAALGRTVAGDVRLAGRVWARRQAIAARRGKLRFAASGLSSAAVSESGDIEVDCVTLDEALDGECPTYIKMDIEGAEPDALNGAGSVFARSRPLAAICAYHAQDHLWRIPLLLHRLAPEARVVLRMYRPDGWELVCYALPPERATNAAAEEAG